MTIAALKALLEEETPDAVRLPAPSLHHRRNRGDQMKENPPMPTNPTAASPAALDEEPTVDDLLAWGDAHPDSTVQDQAARARTALTGLRRRHAADAELAALAEEQEELEARLAQLRARQQEIAPPVKKRRSSTAGGVDTRAVRAWAAEAGVECPARGRVPGRVIEAWRQATGAAVA